MLIKFYFGKLQLKRVKKIAIDMIEILNILQYRDNTVL